MSAGEIPDILDACPIEVGSTSSASDLVNLGIFSSNSFKSSYLISVLFSNSINFIPLFNSDELCLLKNSLTFSVGLTVVFLSLSISF